MRADFRLYRWWQGGIWAKHDGNWFQADYAGYIRGRCIGFDGRLTWFSCHYTFRGNTAVEDYRKPIQERGLQ